MVDALDEAAEIAAAVGSTHPDRVAFCRDMRLDFADNWACDRRFEPFMTETQRQSKILGWRDAVSRTLTRT
jgi:glycerol kinase